ncbi:uncharacterized protein [Triticum aestivum]|uniref:uncharacterized protein n=1 Tax=Triticum aestivum TaxID=4565 RepID=UPI001D022D19|nr:uncharacterized protein LOC123143885 [Triticum aestivum]
MKQSLQRYGHIMSADDHYTRWQQAMPSHLQQAVLLSRHDMARPPYRDSPERKRRRLRFSCSVHAVAGEAKKSSRISCSTTGGMVNECIGWFLTVRYYLEWPVGRQAGSWSGIGG